MQIPASTGLKQGTNEDSAQSPGGGQEGNRRTLKALVIGPVLKQNLTTGKTKEIPEDDLLLKLTADEKLIDPPFEKLVLAMLPEQSTEMGPVIDAMVQNIDGFGYRMEPRVKLDDKELPDGLRKAAERERIKISNFFNNCCIDYSFTELRKRSRRDIESTGEAFWEVLRAPSGQIVGFNHIASHQIRLGRQDEEFTQFKRRVPVLQDDGSVKLEDMLCHKRFRKYAQARLSTITRSVSGSTAWKVRWFKEFGDPRVIDNTTGDLVPEDKAKDFPEAKRANEMIHWKLYSPRTPHGLPRYIGNLITVFGDRAADEINYVTLKNNNIPSMVIMVSNGQLTAGSIERIQEFVEKQIQGSENYSRFLIIEGEGAYEGPDIGHCKLDIKPLTEQQMRDQLFQEYSKNNRDKIREAFRLPPIFVGRSGDFTRATAEASRRLADEQVFKPERDEFDAMMNKLLMPELDVVYHSFRSNGPNVTDDEDLIKILATAERTGGLTPRIARMILADIFGREDLPPMDESIPLDVPFSITLAEKLKNTAPIEAQTGATTRVAPATKSLDPHDTISMILGLRNELESELTARLGPSWRDTATAATG